MRSYRIRAYLNGAQQRLFCRWSGGARWLWNTALAIRSEGYRACGLRLTGSDISRWLTQWKRTAGHEWLAEVPATVLTQCLRDQDRAFSNFFAGRARYPKFRHGRRCGSLRFQGIGAAWSRGILNLPKLGSLRLAEQLPQIDRPDMVTLSREATGQYYLTLYAKVPRALFPIVQRCVGLDVGLTQLATLSTGEKIQNPKHYHSRLRYLRQQTRCLARRVKGSRRREKQRIRVARAHARVRHLRENALHALTTRLVRDVAFGELRRQLAYKSEWAGRVIVAVDRWYPSSKTCSCCHRILDQLLLNERAWICPKCSSHHDRDINAARNLLAEGLRQLAGRDDRDLRVDARDACPEEITLAQVLAGEARSGHRIRACTERDRLEAAQSR